MTKFPTKLRIALAMHARSHRRFPGRYSLLRRTDQILRRFGGDAVDVDVDGILFRLHTEDVIDFNLMYLGFYQSELVHYLAARASAVGAVFWDIGANVGSVSLRLAQLNPNLKIHAFEPSPPVYVRLEENVALNPALEPQFSLHRTALSNESGTASFFVSSEQFNSGVGGMLAAKNRHGRPVEVAAARGDDLLAAGQVSVPSLIKIDVEGFELEVFRGLERFLSTSKNLELVFEHEPYRLRERDLAPSAVVNYLQTLGFVIHQMSDQAAENARPVDAVSLASSCDLVARKRSK